MEKRYPVLLRLENIELLKERKAGKGVEVFLELKREVAMRSYLVYDFKPWGGAMVMDGGLWITYDLASYVKAALEGK